MHIFLNLHHFWIVTHLSRSNIITIDACLVNLFFVPNNVLFWLCLILMFNFVNIVFDSGDGPV